MDRPSAGSQSPRDSHFEIDDIVWSPCANLGYRRSRVVSIDQQTDSIYVGDNSGSQHAVRKSEVRPFYDVGETRTFQDNTEMVHLDDANILDNLRKRYVKDEIYTYTANVLLAVNPYKELPQLYTKEVMSRYWGKNPGTLPPHPYATADVAYRQLLRDRKNQALVISGESGAGKTETAKITMRYLTSMSRTDAAQGTRIQEKIIAANPILESFGNATTVMNLNSSRFGKYNEMMFNPVGSLVGAGIRTFLLESSRVVFQQKGEKNYHVFYELLAGMEEEDLDSLCLDRQSSYKLLHSSGTKPLQEKSVESQRLGKQFKELKQALSIFIDDETDTTIWQVLGALIHLGEVDFVEASRPEDLVSSEPSPCASPCSAAAASASAASASGTAAAATADVGTQPATVEIHPDTEESLETAADLLGMGALSIAKILKFKEMHVNRQGRVSHIKCPRTLAQARQTLQCIIKILYTRLFEKIVARINEVSNAGANPDAHYQNIGTLDIYGFERLEHNSFEQLCINLANERLQQFFVEEVLEAEQRMYAEERLSVTEMELPDSAPVVFGIQALLTKLLDEHSLRAVKNLVRTEDKDQKFCELVHSKLVGKRGPIMALRLKASRGNGGPGLHDGFQISHYAGAVSYSTKGWIDKNNDSLVPEIETVLAEAETPLLQEMADTSRTAHSGERLCSVSSRYLSNLTDLLETLKQCSVHYIRCFNPNQERKPGLFKPKYVLDQVIQCGTVELVKIMHYGFPHRCVLKDLRGRFQKLLPPEFAHYSDRDFMHAVMLAWEIDDSQWTLGTSRLFLKAGQLRALEELRDTGGTASQSVIKKIRLQFAKKKARAFAHGIEFVSYLRKVMVEGKRERTVAGLRKAIRIMLRLNRWKHRSLKRLAPFGGDEETEAIVTRKLGVPFQSMDLKISAAVTPQIFVTMAGCDMPSINEKLHKEVSSAEYDGLFQAQARESVLFFNAGKLKCAKLLGSAFVSKTGASAFADVRLVDCCNTGRAVPVASAPEMEKISVMCQSAERTARSLPTASVRTPSWCGAGRAPLRTPNTKQWSHWPV
ncbi:unnamed protein product [Effrenium voratum]|uniref:Myosin motor domain-containing protein n=1 Tax=Effrenium voratum TaxID=2562239 RepID=A0AA36JQJ7_9DINO|nr:unnamed protein product [Effrenium voratum]